MIKEDYVFLLPNQTTDNQVMIEVFCIETKPGMCWLKFYVLQRDLIASSIIIWKYSINVLFTHRRDLVGMAYILYIDYLSKYLVFKKIYTLNSFIKSALHFRLSHKILGQTKN